MPEQQTFEEWRDRQLAEHDATAGDHYDCVFELDASEAWHARDSEIEAAYQRGREDAFAEASALGWRIPDRRIDE